ncbi:MAG: hypothetical protein R2778_12250 [Saprospiraceae bacterium]
MRIELEDSNSDSEAMVYVADKANSRLDSNLALSNWVIESFEISAGSKICYLLWRSEAFQQQQRVPHAEQR